MTVQLDLLDLLAEIDEPARPALVRPPAIYSYRGRTRADYAAAADQWRKDDPLGGFGLWPISHGWHTYDNGPPADHCHPSIMSADLRCPYGDGSHHQAPCYCVGGLVYLALCEHCGWRSEEASSESRVVLDGLDHAYPGWRDSPVAPPANFCNDTQKKRWHQTVMELYGDRPAGWPVITDRTPPVLRAVEQRSPWGGYDVAVQDLTTHPRRRTRADELKDQHRAAVAEKRRKQATGVHSLSHDEAATIRHINTTSYRNWICYLIGHPDGTRRLFAHHDPAPTGWTTTGTTITWDHHTHSIADWRAWAASLPADLADRARTADEQDDTDAAAQVVAEAIGMSPAPAFGDARHIARYPQPDTCTTYPTASTRDAAGACAGCPCWRNRPVPGPTHTRANNAPPETP